MATHDDLDTTISALDGDLTSVSPGTAAAAIDGWIGRLHAAGMPELVATLTDLKAALTGGIPDGTTIGPLLTRLGTQTSDVSDNADPDTAEKLQRLASLLTTAGGAMH